MEVDNLISNDRIIKSQKDDFSVVLVALYRYRNFAVRIMHPMIEKTNGVKPYVIFFKNCETNISSQPSQKEKEIRKIYYS